MTPASASATASWSQSDRSWYPLYQVRSDANGSAILSLTAGGVTADKGESATLMLSSIQSGNTQQKIAYTNDQTKIVRENLKVSEAPNADKAPYKITIINVSQNLPPGDITCFKSGVYMGKGRFQGGDAGKSLDITCGSR